jgi:hypothetical protein
MSDEQMSEPANPVPPKVKRKYRRRMVAKPAVKPPPRGGGSDDEFAGLTLRSCCSGCNPIDGCVISRCGDPSLACCVHPMTSGCLQAVHKMMPEVMARFDRAKRKLEIQELAIRHEAQTHG